MSYIQINLLTSSVIFILLGGCYFLFRKHVKTIDNLVLGLFFGTIVYMLWTFILRIQTGEQMYTIFGESSLVANVSKGHQIFLLLMIVMQMSSFLFLLKRRLYLDRFLCVLGTAINLIVWTSGSIYGFIVGAILALLPFYLSEGSAKSDLKGMSFRGFNFVKPSPLVLLQTAAVVLQLVVFITILTRGRSHFLDLVDMGQQSFADSLLVPLLVLTLVIRLGLVPFHGLILGFCQRSSMIRNTVVNQIQISAALMFLVILPLARNADPVLLQVLKYGFVACSFYLLALAFVVKDLRSFIKVITLLHFSIILFKIGAASHGVLDLVFPFYIGITLALNGLAFAGICLEDRFGAIKLGHISGLWQKAPTLAGVFIFFALACVNFPGTFGYVAEDILFRSLFHDAPVVSFCAVMVLSLLAIRLFQWFFQLFALPEGESAIRMFLTKRERFVFALMILCIVGLGFFPNAALL